MAADADIDVVAAEGHSLLDHDAAAAIDPKIRHIPSDDKGHGGRGHIQVFPRSQGRCCGRWNEVYALYASVEQGIHQGMPGDGADFYRYSHCHIGPADGTVKAFIDKETEHILRHVIIGDDPVLHRPLQRIIRRFLMVADQCLRTKAKHLAADIIHRHCARFFQDHLIPLVYTNLGRPHVYAQGIQHCRKHSIHTAFSRGFLLLYHVGIGGDRKKLVRTGDGLCPV